MFAKNLTGCFGHCCVEGDDHWIHVCIFIVHDGERCKLPAYHNLDSFQRTGNLFRFSRSNLSLVCFGLLVLFRRRWKAIISKSWSLPMSATSNWTELPTECLNCSKADTVDYLHSLRKGVEAAVQSLKKGKSAGVDIIPGELVHSGRGDVITALTAICNKIWQTEEWPTAWAQSLVITLPKKGNLQQCQNYRTINFISHPSRVMLKIIWSRLKL